MKVSGPLGRAFRFTLCFKVKTASAELQKSRLRPLDHPIVPLLEGTTIPLLVLLLFLLIGLTVWLPCISLDFFISIKRCDCHLTKVFTAPGFRGPFVYYGIMFMLKIRNQLLSGRKKSDYILMKS